MESSMIQTDLNICFNHYAFLDSQFKFSNKQRLFIDFLGDFSALLVGVPLHKKSILCRG